MSRLFDFQTSAEVREYVSKKDTRELLLLASDRGMDEWRRSVIQEELRRRVPIIPAFMEPVPTTPRLCSSTDPVLLKAFQLLRNYHKRLEGEIEIEGPDMSDAELELMTREMMECARCIFSLETRLASSSDSVGYDSARSVCGSGSSACSKI